MTTETWAAGEEVVRLETPLITRAMLALYAGASGDHNPIHIDLDAARSAGMPDVIGHGMLAMAFLGRTLTCAVDQRRVRTFGVRFQRPVSVGDVLTCTVTAGELNLEGREAVRMLALEARNQAGEVKLTGTAQIAL